MPELSGFDVAQQLNEIYRDVLIVFITGYDNLVYNSINYRPIGFISKDKLSDLSTTFSYVIKELESTHTRHCYTYDNITHTIKEQDILYFKKKGNYLSIYTISDTYKIRKTLKELESTLNPNLFIKVSQSTIINIRHVHTIDQTTRTIILDNNTNIIISRSLKKHVTGFYFKTIRSRI